MFNIRPRAVRTPRGSPDTPHRSALVDARPARARPPGPAGGARPPRPSRARLLPGRPAAAWAPRVGPADAVHARMSRRPGRATERHAGDPAGPPGARAARAGAGDWRDRAALQQRLRPVRAA